MSSGTGPALAHRSVTSIRSAPTQGQAGPATPQTPPRTTAPTYGSPSTIRADDDFLIIQLGSRFVRVGFAGDSLPKATLSCGPKDQRRVGDFRAWQQPVTVGADAWTMDHEIWSYDLRDVDLGLVHDKLDRLLRDAFTRCLLIDSRPRRTGIVLDSAVPIPLISTVLDLMFKNFQAPMVSLMSSATMSAVAAGVRSALVIDIGWTETVVTSVYEYREVKSTRSIRGGKFLLEAFYKMLCSVLKGDESLNENKGKRAISFDECEDIMCRLAWCRQSAFSSPQRQSAQLDTVEEQDEFDAEHSRPKGTASIPLMSTNPRTTVDIPFDKMADICDDTFFDQSIPPSTFDDHELPIHLLVYRQLLQLPIDVRAICMSRIVFTGGCSSILGIKGRIVDEVTGIVNKRGWAPISGKSVEESRHSRISDRRASIPRPISSPATASESGDDTVSSRPSSISTQTDEDPIEAKVARNRPKVQQVQGEFRAIHSLGPWAGSSLLCQLKVPAMATIEREQWLQQGASGASRPSEIDSKMQRQSMGTGGLIRGSGGQHHQMWTLGAWGTL